MNTDKRLWRNRKAKKELARQLQSENPGLEVVHPHSAGIDVGSGAHYVAVRPDRDLQPVPSIWSVTLPPGVEDAALLRFTLTNSASPSDRLGTNVPRTNNFLELGADLTRTSPLRGQTSLRRSRSP
jgi:hypothetical protein